MSRLPTWCVVVVVGMMALGTPASADAAPGADPYATCRAQFDARPDDYESAYCFFQLTLDGNLWLEGMNVFEALIRRHPNNAWLTLSFGHVHRSREPSQAEALYRRAAEAFRSSGHEEGELVARSTLRDFLFPLGRVDEASREIARVIEIGEATRDPLLRARAWNLQAYHVQDSGGDLGFAFRLLKQAEAAIFPDGPYRSKRVNLNSLGQVASRMGRLGDALAAFRRLDTLTAEQGDAQWHAIARYNVFNTIAMQESLLPTSGGRERLIALAERALESATTAQHAMVQAKSHGALAELLARSPGGRPTALTHAAQCLTLAATAQLRYDEAVCAWIEAALHASTDPARARAAEVKAIEATRRANNPRTQAYSAGRHMRHSWTTRPRTQAIRDSLAAIDSVETLRALQDDASSSADLFSAWTLDYYWLSGRLFQEGRDEDVALGFSITERMRARALLDELDRRQARRDPHHPAVTERRALLETIARVQRTLMDPRLDDGRREARLLELERLERQEQEARRQMALASPDARSASPSFTSLETIQSSLSEHEALLSFQAGLWDTYEGDFGGGSWLLAVTRSARRVHRLPDRTVLATMVPMFSGLLGGTDGREAPAAVRLYQDLLSEAVASLPASVTRLIVVADGPLHQLPFEALRPAATGPPIGARYEFVMAPSATLWHQWRGRAVRRPAGRVLTFADPELPATTTGDGPMRNALLFHGLRLGRLPYAREESRAIGRHAGGADSLVGVAASEHALKTANLGGYDILHFAAHAVADDSHPERSAVLLASGHAKEDGLLQAREIEALELDGGIVVLSACQTAAGAVQSGEGVLSLARAFFAAGAHAVIGSRWPLRDADAATLFESVYRHLGRGESLSAALKTAQDEARAAGRPASTWAGLILLGNGDLRPFAGRTPVAAQPGYTVLAALTLAGAFVCGGLLLHRRREPRWTKDVCDQYRS